MLLPENVQYGKSVSIGKSDIEQDRMVLKSHDLRECIAAC